MNKLQTIFQVIKGKSLAPTEGTFNSFNIFDLMKGIQADLNKGTASRCIDMIGKSLGALEWQVKQDDEVLGDHWFYNIIDTPNRFNPSWQSFLEQYIYALISGGNVLYQVKDTSEVILWDWKHVTPKFGNGVISYYEYMEGGTTVRIPIEETVHIKTLTTGSYQKTNLIGTPKVFNSASEYIKAEQLLQTFTENEISSGGISPVMITTQDNSVMVEGPQLEALKKQLRTIYGDQQKFIIGEGLKPEVFTKSAALTSDAYPSSMGGIKTALLEAICMQMGVPSIIATGKLIAGKDNARTIVNWFYDYTVTPYANVFAQYMSEWIRSVDRDRSITLDFVRPKYMDFTDEMTMARFEWDKEDRENAPTQTNLSLYPKPNGVRTAVKSATDEELLKAYEVRVKSLTDDLEKPIKEWVKELQEVIINNVDDNFKSLSGLFSLDLWGKKLRERVSPILAIFIVKRVQEIQAELGDEPQRLPTLEQESLSESLSKITEPAKTIDKEMLKIIKEEVNKDPRNALANIKERINNKFTEHYSESKVKIIAEQSAKVAENGSKSKVYRKKGWKLQWIANTFVDGGNFREDHADLHRQIVSSEEKFIIKSVGENGDTSVIATSYPSEPSQPASQAIGCKCTIRAVR